MITSSKFVHVYAGKILDLMCITHDHGIYGPPEQIVWFINGSKIDFASHRGGINIQTEKRWRSSKSKLILLDVRHVDAGIYECKHIWKTGQVQTFLIIV